MVVVTPFRRGLGRLAARRCGRYLGKRSLSTLIAAVGGGQFRALWIGCGVEQPAFATPRSGGEPTALLRPTARPWSRPASVGWVNLTIAARLGLSTKTVANYERHPLLAATDRVDAARIIRAHPSP